MPKSHHNRNGSRKKLSKQPEKQTVLEIEDQIVKSLQDQTAQGFWHKKSTSLPDTEIDISPWNQDYLKKTRASNNYSLPSLKKQQSSQLQEKYKFSNASQPIKSQEKFQLKLISNQGRRLELKPLFPILKVSESSTVKLSKIEVPIKMKLDEPKIREELKKIIHINRVKAQENQRCESEPVVIKKNKSLNDVHKVLLWDKKMRRADKIMKMNMGRIERGVFGLQYI